MTEAINRLPEFEQQENQEVKTGTMDLSIVPLKKITSTKGDLKSHKSLSKSEKSANGGDIEKCTPPKRP
jgi:hypothetical protein